MVYRFYYDIFSIVICSILLVGMARVRTFAGTSTNVLKKIIAANICCNLLKIIAFSSLTFHDFFPHNVVLVLCTVYAVFQFAVGFTMFYYAVTLVGTNKKHNKILLIVDGVISFFCAVIYVVAMACKWLYSIEDGQIILSPAFTHTYSAFAIFSFVLAFVCLWRSFMKMPKGVRVFCILTTIPCCILVSFEFITNYLSFMGYSVMLIVAIVYFGVERFGFYADSRTNQPNERALTAYVNHMTRSSTPFDIISFTVYDYEKTCLLLGIESAEDLIDSVCIALSKEFKKEAFFRVEQNKFVVCLSEKNDVEKCIERIEKTFENLDSTQEAITLPYRILSFSYPDCFTDLQSMYGVAKYASAILRSENKKYLAVDKALIDDYKQHGNIEKVLNDALENDGLQVYFQPIVDINDGKIFACEALVRLFDSSGKLLPTDKVIEVAERNGSVVALGEQVLNKVCKFIYKNIYSGHLQFPQVCVNISAVQFMQNDFASQVAKIIDDNGIYGSSICLELTETTLSSNKRMVARHMDELRERGVEFACDDYGTGYSSSAYIVSFPFSIIKFDRSLVNSFCLDRTTQMLLGSEIYTCLNLGFKVVLEGVETKEQLDLIKSKGIEYVQGYYYSRPLPEKEFIDYCIECGKK